MVKITGVEKNSPAGRAKILPGDILLEINGHAINDVLDYNFRLAEKRVTLKLHRGPELLDVTLKKSEYGDIGLTFENFLMDEQKRCKNKCVFCFIDQNPPGMRETVYFKDDDSRMSFLSGSYVTMTNMTDEDIDRIIEMKMSPVNVSVHTTNPELRVKMMGNPNAAKIMTVLKRLAGGNIKLHCQLVLCRGINDGEELRRSMNDLDGLYPAVESVSIVPCGLTKYRGGLYPLTAFSAEDCETVIAAVEGFAQKCLEKRGDRIFWCGDEFYVKAGRRVPPPEYYGEFAQLENGVGMLSLLSEEFENELLTLTDEEKAAVSSVSIATGAAAGDYIAALVEKLTKTCYNFKCGVYIIKNEFYGENVTVAGLLTGGDIFTQLSARGAELGDRLLLPQCSLRYEGDLFLDGMSAAELSKKLGVKIEFVPNDGAALVRSLLGLL